MARGRLRTRPPKCGGSWRSAAYLGGRESGFEDRSLQPGQNYALRTWRRKRADRAPQIFASSVSDQAIFPFKYNG
jgi:hypothetical protein